MTSRLQSISGDEIGEGCVYDYQEGLYKRNVFYFYRNRTML